MNSDTYYELCESMEYSILMELKEAIDSNKARSTINWQPVLFDDVKSLWRTYGNLGFIRDEEKLEEIVVQTIINAIKFTVVNDICGHSPNFPEYTVEDIFDKKMDYGEFWDFLEENDMEDFFTYAGYDIISDYGLPQINEIVAKIVRTNNLETKLILVDNIFNIVHQRNNLALFFIEGGSESLFELSDLELETSYSQGGTF